MVVVVVVAAVTVVQVVDVVVECYKSWLPRKCDSLVQCRVCFH